MKFEEKLVEDFVISPAKAEAEVTKAIDWNQPGEASIDSAVITDLEIAKQENSKPAELLLHWVDDLLEAEEDQAEKEAADVDQPKSLTSEFIPDSDFDGAAMERPPDIDDPWVFSSARRKAPDDGDGGGDGGGGGGGGGGDGDGDDAPTAPDDGDKPRSDKAKTEADKAKTDKAKTDKPKPDKKADDKPKADKPARAPKSTKPDDKS